MRKEFFFGKECNVEKEFKQYFVFSSFLFYFFSIVVEREDRRDENFCYIYLINDRINGR